MFLRYTFWSYHPSFFSYNCSQGKDWRDWASGCSSRRHYCWLDGVFSCIWKYDKHCALRTWQVACKFKIHYVAYLWSNIIFPKFLSILIVKYNCSYGLLLPIYRSQMDFCCQIKSLFIWQQLKMPSTRKTWLDVSLISTVMDLID